jgi:hypothetical protein
MPGAFEGSDPIVRIRARLSSARKRRRLGVNPSQGLFIVKGCHVRRRDAKPAGRR